MEYSQLNNEVLHCTKCGLSKSRNNVIVGEGNLNAKLFLIGEAPGRDEDIQGRPFVGKSGQLLDKILEACGFNRREHVYISNIIKCRPPGNRVPNEYEAETCMPYLLKQIDIINPEIILLLGSTALKYMFGQDKRITRIHGTWLEWKKKPAMPVYHPAAILRNPTLKREVWEDYKKVVFKYRELVNPDHYSAHV